MIEEIGAADLRLIRRHHASIPAIVSLRATHARSPAEAEQRGWSCVLPAALSTASLWLRREAIAEVIAAARAVEERRLADAAQRGKLERAVRALGWSAVDARTVSIPRELRVRLGPREAIVSGGVAVPAPAELTREAGLAATEPIVEAARERIVTRLSDLASRILAEPDDETFVHRVKRIRLAEAVDAAQQEIAAAYNALADRRLASRVERELGLAFYLHAFVHARPRRIRYFVGPTNSGKTHAALELLAQARTGVYLAPLRLLALEAYERLGERHVPISLLTGEERISNVGSTHVSSTVEMVDLGAQVDVAVIDEAQMLGDRQRGWAWTTAIAGVRADEVVLCGSEEGLALAGRLTERLGLRMTVQRFTRKTPLRVGQAVPQLASLRPGDAVVVFSRRDVVTTRATIAAQGFSTAVVYGSLSPQVRRREAERFRSGEAQILVATDAIGLGLNLPIHRIVFAMLSKFDGIESRRLTPVEIRQIAGRAGRFGMYDDGIVTAQRLQDIRHIVSALAPHEPQDPGPLWISPTTQHLEQLAGIINDDRVGQLLRFAQTRLLQHDDADLRIADLADPIAIATRLEQSRPFRRLPIQTRAAYARAPVSARDERSIAALCAWGERHAANEGVDAEDCEPGPALRAADPLLPLEERARLTTLYLWLAQRFPEVFVARDRVSEIREEIDGGIEEILVARGAKRRGKIKRPQSFVRPGVRRRA